MSRARIPANVDIQDRLLAGLTARQLAILATAGLAAWALAALARALLPLPAAVGLGWAVLVVGLALALGRRDGLSLDRLLWGRGRPAARTATHGPGPRRHPGPTCLAAGRAGWAATGAAGAARLWAE